MLRPSVRAASAGAALIGFFAAAAAAEKPHVTIENGADVPISRLFVTGAEEGGWREDVLGATTLAPGATHEVPLGQGCRFDVKALYADGREAEFHDVDLCAEPRLNPR